MLKRVISKYSKEEPYEQINETEVFCSAVEMRNLFDVSDDLDMIFTYPIKTQEQIEFFKNHGINIDLNDGFFYIESYNEYVG